MMKKLFKWEFIFYIKELKFLLIGSILLSLVYIGLNELSLSYAVLSFFSGTAYVISIIGVLSLILFTYFLILQRYYKTMLKDEGYFTHSLPLKKYQILIYKMVTAFTVWLVVLSVGVLLLIWIKLIPMDMIKQMIEADATMLPMLSITVASFVLTSLVMILVFYSALSFGFSFNKSEWLYVFLYFIGYYVLNQILSLINLGINLIINPGFFELDESNIFQSITPLLVIQLIFILAIGVASFIITNKIITKKLNLKNG